MSLLTVGVLVPILLKFVTRRPFRTPQLPALRLSGVRRCAAAWRDVELRHLI
jgi:hypothetical protein